MGRRPVGREDPLNRHAERSSIPASRPIAHGSTNWRGSRIRAVRNRTDEPLCREPSGDSVHSCGWFACHRECPSRGSVLVELGDCTIVSVSFTAPTPIMSPSTIDLGLSTR